MTRVATDGQYCQMSPGPGPLDGPSLVLLCHLVAFRRYHVSDRHNSYGIPLRTSPVGTPFPRQGQRSWWYCGLCPTEEEGGAGPARDPLALSSPPPPPLPTRPGVPTPGFSLSPAAVQSALRGRSVGSSPETADGALLLSWAQCCQGHADVALVSSAAHRASRPFRRYQGTRPALRSLHYLISFPILCSPLCQPLN